jgi:PIN domain-containing protein
LKRQSDTNAQTKRQLKRTTFFLERSLYGATIFKELRDAGLTVEAHGTRFRHNTEDVDWLAVVGEKKWVVLMRDLSIGRNPIELNALLYAKVRAFVLQRGDWPDAENARIVITAMPKILRILRECKFPFIAKIMKDTSVFVWKTQPVKEKRRTHKG